MSLLKRIRNILQSEEKEKLETRLDEIDETFRQERIKEIEKARDRRDGLVQQSRDIISDIEDSLEEVRGFEDEEDLDIVEDVAENFYNTRKNLLKNLELSEDIEKHSEDFNSFVEEFNDVSMKEGAVMQRIHSKSGKLGESIEEAVDHSEELEKFVENGFKPVLKLREYSDEKAKLERKRRKLDSVKSELEDLEIEKAREKVSEKKEEITELEESDEMARKEELESQREKLVEKRDSSKKSIERNISGIERGLKKAIYAIENGEIEFSGRKSDLQRLLDREYMEKPEAAQNLGGLVDKLESNSILEGRQLESFREGCRELENLGDRVEEVRSLEDEIEKLEEEIDDLEVAREYEELEEELSRLQEELDRLEERRSELKQERDELEEEIRQEVQQLEKNLSQELGREVEIEQ